MAQTQRQCSFLQEVVERRKDSLDRPWGISRSIPGRGQYAGAGMALWWSIHSHNALHSAPSIKGGGVLLNPKTAVGDPWSETG